MEVSIINDVNAERETFFSFWLDSDIWSEKLLLRRQLSPLSIHCWTEITDVALAIFPESGRAEAGYGDLLEQVRAGHNG